MNITELLARDKAKKHEKSNVLPVVKVVRHFTSSKLQVSPIEPAISSAQHETSKDSLLKELWAKDSQIRTARAKLSSKIHRMMDDPNATQEDRKKLYAQIESYRPELQSNYDLIQYIEKNGHLPPNKIEQPKQYSVDIIQLKERKQELIWERDRLRRSLKQNAKPKNPDRISLWQERLAVADAEYNDVMEKIKQLNNGAVSINDK